MGTDNVFLLRLFLNQMGGSPLTVTLSEGGCLVCSYRSNKRAARGQWNEHITGGMTKHKDQCLILLFSSLPMD